MRQCARTAQAVAARKRGASQAEIDAIELPMAPDQWYKQPIYYKGNRFAVSGPGEDVPRPSYSRRMDYECELVIVVGKRCRDVPEDQALDQVLGYAVGNDVSHRWWQLNHGGQWSHGKGFDGWAPYGPGIVSAKELGDPHKLAIWTKLNGKTLQVRSAALFSRERCC